MTNEDSSHGPALNLSFLFFFPSLSFDDFFSFLESFLESFAFFFAFFFCDKHEGWERFGGWMRLVCAQFMSLPGGSMNVTHSKRNGVSTHVCVDSKADFRLG